MNTTYFSSIEFTNADISAQLFAAPDSNLDGLNFGVVEMGLSGKVLRYNATESRYSGLAAERVLGRQFLTEVAPCSKNAKVAHRFHAALLDDEISYTFALRRKPVPVPLRLVKAAEYPRMEHTV